jgi:hypothetical protein
MKGGDRVKTTILIASLVMAFSSTPFAASNKTTCRITGKSMDQCCCEMKNGKFYCKLTKKTYDKYRCDIK